MNQELFSSRSQLPVMGVPISIADYFCNQPPEEIDGGKIQYMRADGTPAVHKIFYAESENGCMSFFELLDMKGDCKINGKTVYRRFFITPVYAVMETETMDKSA